MRARPLRGGVSAMIHTWRPRSRGAGAAVPSNVLGERFPGMTGSCAGELHGHAPNLVFRMRQTAHDLRQASRLTCEFPARCAVLVNESHAVKVDGLRSQQGRHEITHETPAGAETLQRLTVREFRFTLGRAGARTI